MRTTIIEGDGNRARTVFTLLFAGVLHEDGGIRGVYGVEVCLNQFTLAWRPRLQNVGERMEEAVRNLPISSELLADLLIEIFEIQDRDSEASKK